MYQGLWRAGQPFGPGMYKVRSAPLVAPRSHGRGTQIPASQWANGNEYNGEWVSGRMCGRGTFVWASGERYDGEWKDGKEEGRGAHSAYPHAAARHAHGADAARAADVQARSPGLTAPTLMATGREARNTGPASGRRRCL